MTVCSFICQAGTYSGGDGSPDNPFQIQTSADWVALTGAPDDWDKHFVLTADIDLAGIELTPVAPDLDPDYGFQGVSFKGCFEGQGYTITNAAITMPDQDYAALFGCVGAGGNIRNLRIENIQVIGRQYVAGLTGANGNFLESTTSGTLYNCHVSGSVSGTFVDGSATIIGGLCGDNYFGTILNCSAAVSVIGGDNITAMGGLCAWNWNGTIRNSYATGPVSGGANSVQIGGFCGFSFYGTILNCYSRGDVSGGDRIGGFIGVNSGGNISFCYAAGKSIGTSNVKGFGGGVLGYSAETGNFWDIQTSGLNDTMTWAIGLSTAQMKRLPTFLAAGWEFTEANGDPAIWRMPADGYPLLAWQRYSGGSGSAGDPYQIGAVADWLELINTPDDWKRQFVLVNDIDFQGLHLTPVAPDTDALTNGFQGPLFTGRFDGQNYVLRNAVINLPEQDFVGLFGAVGTVGKIHNLGVTNVTVVGRSRVGGLVGLNMGGSINKCYTTGDVTATAVGNNWAGGLVGVTTLYGDIADCFSTAAVSGHNRVGGLAGQIGAGLIRGCYASGPVTAAGQDAGGLVGLIYDPEASGTIRNSYAVGNVSGTANIGGLVGNNSRGKVIYCYSTGRPSGNSNVGGFCGAKNTGSGYEDTGNLWDTQTSLTTSSVMGMGRSTAQMKTVSTFTLQGLNFDTVWWMPYDDKPRLQWERGYSGGNGSQAHPYRIGTAADWLVLQSMPEHWDKHFVLISDIDFGGKRLTPIGREFDPGALDPLTISFTGVFDGKGHRVRNATIQLPHYGYHGGLFGHVGEARIENLGVQNVSVSGGFMLLGGLCGYNESGVINNCFASGAVTGGEHSSYIGGLCGLNKGTIKNCHAQVEVNAGANTSYIGGLTGCNFFGSITDSFAAGKVTGSYSSSEVGGLAGLNAIASISNSYATGDVAGGSGVGGFVGFNNGGSITHCFSTGKPTGTQTVGGFCGDIGPQGDNLDMGNFWDMESSGIDASAMGSGRTTAEMKTPGTFTAAGWDPQFVWRITDGRYPRLFKELRGYSGGQGTTADPYRIGTVIDWLTLCASTDHWDKTFVLTGDIDFADTPLTPIAPDTDPHTEGFQGRQFTGFVNGQGFTLRNAVIDMPDRDFVGLFGDLGKYGCLYNISVENAAVKGASRVGGLVGRNDSGTIYHCRLAGSVAGAGTSSFSVGGLVGVARMNGTIKESRFSGTVAGGSRIGGLVGNLSNSTIDESFATGQVSGSGENIGGLIGYLYDDSNSYSMIRNCYARVRVIGGVNVGGLIGQAYQGYIYRCYSTGRPTGTNSVGGVFGRRNAVINDYAVFWDTQTSGTSSGAGTGSTSGVMGRSTFAMKTQTTFTGYGWDFTNTWAICEDTNYPRLRWQIPNADWVCPDGVGIEDLLHFAARWMHSQCIDADRCNGTDLNGDGEVNLIDFVLIAETWLTGR